jgi:glycosyltransferase involved in cell wall biosynthesis
MPVYNGARYLEQAIQSLLAQTVSDFVVHISDNHSDDATPEICTRLAKDDTRIRYERQQRNMGMAANFNYLLQAATSPFFAWAAHDDLREPEFLATCLELLSKAPDAVACSVGVKIVDQGGLEIGRVPAPTRMASQEPLERARAVTSLGAWPVYGLLNREALGPDVQFRDHLGADLAFTFDLALRGRILSSEKTLLTYRWADDADKLEGPEVRLYDYSRTPTEMYLTMARDIRRAPLHLTTKTRLQLHVAGQWLARTRWVNSRAIHRAWVERQYRTAALRLPAALILEPLRALFRICSWLAHRGKDS